LLERPKSVTYWPDQAVSNAVQAITTSITIHNKRLHSNAAIFHTP